MRKLPTNGRELLLYCQILNPFALLDHKSAQGALDPVRSLDDEVQGQNGDAGKTAQAESERYADTPDKAAVKEEGDHALTAGAEGEVGGVGV
jgi:hypothetical protein